jgi:hypothetical protein
MKQVILDDPPIGGKFRDGPVRAFFQPMLVWLFNGGLMGFNGGLIRFNGVSWVK